MYSCASLKIRAFQASRFCLLKLCETSLKLLHQLLGRYGSKIRRDLIACQLGAGRPSNVGSVDDSLTSMDPQGEHVIWTWKKPCRQSRNESEFPETSGVQNIILYPCIGATNLIYQMRALSALTPGRSGLCLRWFFCE